MHFYSVATVIVILKQQKVIFCLHTQTEVLINYQSVLNKPISLWKYVQFPQQELKFEPSENILLGTNFGFVIQCPCFLTMPTLWRAHSDILE